MLYQWRYQVPTDVADRQPAQLEREAIKAAVRDAKHDGWQPSAPPLFNAYEAFGLENVTDLVVTFAVHPQERSEAFYSPGEVGERFPAQPLVDLVGNRNVTDMFTKSQERAFYRGRAQGWFTLDAADKLSIALGRTLETVWPPCALSRPSDTLASATEGAA